VSRLGGAVERESGSTGGIQGDDTSVMTEAMSKPKPLESIQTGYDFRTLPKVELHLHLDCCLSYEAVQRLAPDISPEVFRRDFIAPPKCLDLADFLRTPAHHVALLQSEEALRIAVDDLFAQLARDAVLYVEVRFAPLQHTQRGLSPEQAVAAVESAVAQASAATGVMARIILCTLRHFTPTQSLETVRLVERFRGTRVAAFDIAGGEAGYPLDAHLAAFRYAIERGLPRTAHAGEACGPDSVWKTLRQLQPARIGHGVRSIEDAGLLAHLRATGVHLEVCPSSNVQTDVVPVYRDHPVDALYRHGMSLGISTDSRTVTDLSLTTEYERLHEAFGWGVEHFLAVNLNAVHAAFVPPAVRRDLEERLREQYRRL
jgi:adenosine deaminase